MPRTMLAVQQRAADYLRPELVTEARSFEEAKKMIIRAEKIGQPFDDLDLPVRNEKQFWAFIEWMRKRGRKYPFSIHGYKGIRHFLMIRDKSRAMGFHFNS